MMRSLVRSAILVFALAATGFTQISFDFTGSGARARGMGGAFIGVSDDITGGTWNPAGLWVHEGPKFGLDYGALLPRGESEVGALTQGQSGSWNSVGALSFLAPLRIRGHQFVASVSYSSLFEDFSAAYARRDDTYELPGMLTPEAYYLTVDQEAHWDPRALILGMGTRLSEKVSFGVSADIYLGSAVARTERITVAENFPDFDSPQTATATQRVLGLDTVKYSGFGLTGGIKYTGEKYGVGLIVRAPFTFKSETDSKVFANVKYAGLDQPDQSDTTFVDDQLIKYDLPLMFGVGVSYQLTERLMWALDAEYRGFEGRDAEVRVSRNLSEDTETYEKIETEWRNVFTVRTGAEYMWETGKSAFPLVPLRAGFAYVPIPSPDIALDAMDAEPNYSSAAGYRLSAGFGLWWEQINLDFAYSLSVLDRESFFALGALELNEDFVPVPVELRNRSHSLSVTFTGHF